MAPLSLKVVLDEGAVTRTVMFESTMRVDEAQAIVREKILTAHDGKNYGLFLTSADDDYSGIWLEQHRQLDYYMLRDGDQLHYLCRLRTLRVQMLDGSVKTMPVDEAKTVEELMVGICGRLGITNHDEYGLCHIEEEDPDDNKIAPGTGTLTRRVTQQRDRDAKLQQMSKKLKTDDHVEWLDQHKTLRELRVDPTATVLLKRRLFYSDRNVDARDPVQLNLLYVQARDAILQGRHPVTEDRAVEFAGIQCQIHYGDFNEEKHKPGLIENLSEYLPQQYSSSWGIEKKILKEFRKHHGLSQIEAKYLYTKTARDLPTYGVTFFLVKEKQKGKKKLVPRLLGINAESILRLDEVTKEVLQVWPLTQVKTYHAGKSETFTLNFGDYSDKEYSVKTNDAHRIRDILQGYIDIIKKRMDAKYNLNLTEHHAICEDMVQASRGHIMERIDHKPNKIVEESFVGPSQIFTYEPGKGMAQGTQIVTVQQLVIHSQGGQQQTVKVGEVPMRKGMPLDFVRKLNRLNSNSVKIVTLLTEPNQANLSEASKIVDNMEADMPSLIEGVREAANKETDEEAKKRMLSDLQELIDNMKALSDSINTNKPEEAQDASKRIADLSIQMCCALDPRMKKRGEFCRRSRKSFLEDEKTNASIRRGSALAAASHLSDTIQKLLQHMIQEYEGPPLDASDIEELEKSAAYKMDKINAAIALNLMAFADPQNVDYGVAVTSMNNINELLPKLAKDAKALGSVQDGNNRQQFLDAVRALCDATRAVCSAADLDDHQKMRDAAKDYGKASDKLLFTFRRGANRNADKEKEILDLSKDVDDRTKALLQKTEDLNACVSETEVKALREACARCSDAAEDLNMCAELTATSIHEPHCRSALKAAAENLSSSAQHLAVTWKPMVEDPTRKHMGDELKDKTLDLAKALDRLKGAFACLDGVPEELDDVKASQKLKFVTTMAAAKKDIKAVEEELNKPLDEVPKRGTEEELQNRLAQKLAQLNAALAALVNATADRDKPDYHTAELAVSTIRELMPDIVKDGKSLSAYKEAASRERMMNEMRALCEATRDICDSNNDMDDVNHIASKFAASSGKLNYIFNPRANRNDEKQITGISSSANEKSSQLLAAVQELVQRVDNDSGLELEIARCRAEAAAKSLHNAARIAAPCIQDPRCQESLISAIDTSSAANEHLGLVVARVLNDPRYKDLGGNLENQLLLLRQELDKLRKACQDIGAGEHTPENKDINQEAMKMQFIRSANDARKNVDAAYRELDKPFVAPKRRIPPEEISRNLTDALHLLTATVSDLLTATANRENPDYLAANDAFKVVNRLLPQIVKDAKTFSSSDPEDKKAAMLEDLRAFCDATKTLCELAPQQDSQELNQAAVKFAGVTGKLVYVFDPEANPNREHDVVEKSSSACETASELLSSVYSLASQLPPAPASRLDTAGSALADSANALLTTTQVTAPYVQDRACQAKLLSSVDRLQTASDQLATIWRPLVKDPEQSLVESTLRMLQEKLDKELEKLRRASHITNCGLQTQANDSPMHPVPSEKRLKFINSISAVDNILKILQEELDKPLEAAHCPVPSSLQNKLAHSLAKLNAAIANLLAATSDKDDQDCVQACKSVDEFYQIIPEIVRGVRMVSATKDPQTQELMLEDLRSLCEATRQICTDAGNGSYADLKEHATILADKSGKLFYAVSPLVDHTKEYEIIDLTMEACKKTAQLLSSVQSLTSQCNGEMALPLDSAGTVTADAADTMLATAQLTAPSIHDPTSRATLISSADAVTSALSSLQSVWKPIVNTSQHPDKGPLLDSQKKDVEQALDKLKVAILEDRIATKSPMRKAPPPPPKRVSSYEPASQSPGLKDATRDFLQNIRDEETQAAGEALLAAEKKKEEEEKAQQKKFIETVDASVQQIQKAGEELTKLYCVEAEVIPALSPEQTAVVQKQMEHKLAAAAAAAARLLAAQHMSSLDHGAACEPATTLAEITPRIVQDAKLLRGALNEDERKLFMEDVLALFDAIKVLLGAAKNDHRKINESAVMFGNKSAKLLYVVSTDVDPSQEKEVFSQARSIGDAASTLALSCADRAPASEQHHAACACADRAGALIYTAKLVAPSIHIAECQQSLVKATDELSRDVKGYSDSWTSVQTDEPTKRQINGDVDKLQRMLDNFKEELQSGKLVKRVPVERITVHHTPLRNLACQILEDAQKRAKQVGSAPEQRAKFAKYATDLGQAVRQVDLMYHRSCNAPHDVEKRQQLENAVQGLQVMVLMERPTARAPHDNIVDLTDYVRAVSEEAEKLHKECKENQPELKLVREHCENIKEKAARTMNPELYDQAPGGLHDRNDVAEFAEECDIRVKSINSILDGLEDGKNKINLQEKAARLTECSHLLSFATKCDLATTQSVSLDATLEELTDLEKKIDEMLAVTGKQRGPYKVGFRPSYGRRKLLGAVCGGMGNKSLAPVYASYLDDIRVAGDCNEQHQKQRAKEHLLKVLGLLKGLVMTNSRHVTTWQPQHHPDTANITEQIIQELESYDAALTDDGNQKSVLDEININRLLLPTRSKLQVDPKEFPEKLNQASSKLCCAVGTLVQGAGNPTAISRAASALLQAHTNLVRIANSAPVQDIAHSHKIDDATKEMSLQTYNVLKSAELVSQQSNNYATRCKLLDACNRLNDAISQLVRTTSPSGKLQKECSELIFRSQLQQNMAQTPNWCCSLNYPDTLLQLQNQRDFIQKLNEEAPIPRGDFVRSLAYVSSAADRSCQYAAHAAYLLSISDQNKEFATEGFVDVARIQNLSETLQESCHRIIRTDHDQAKEEAPIVIKQVLEFQEAITEAQDKIKDEKDKNELKESSVDLEEAMTELNAIVHEKTLSSARLTAVIFKILDSSRSICYIIERVSIVPDIKDCTDENKACRDDVLKNSRNLNTKLLALIREVKSSEDADPMTWVTFGTRKAVLDMFEALVNSVQENGKRARILETSTSDNEEESNQAKKNLVQIQLDLIKKWLARPTVKPDIKTAGEEAARTIISLGEKISEDLSGQEKEEMQDLITSSEELLTECLKKHEPEKARLLAERLKALSKAIERGVVARVVEDFLEGEEPLADLDILVDAEKDEAKRKFLLERKIAELLAHLGRVTKTARVVAGATNNKDTNKRLLDSTQQSELLAPMLVQAAQKRVISPDDQAAIEHYQKLLAQYAESLANIRKLCDEAVDPMDFVQTAGETMQRLREDTTNDSDPQKCAYASTAITKLANRVITVSMSSSDVRKDPELQKALKEAKERLKAVVHGPNTRPSRIPDWKDTTAEILRTTGEVESVLGGEMIFKKQQTSDEPIFAAALDLHTAIRSWSAKDNEIVAVAKRMAVLVAKLSHYMNTERKRDVIVTAKSIVNESREVAELAARIAHECTDIRIKTNLLKICEKIPTISGQLKMLATVKGSLGHQGLKEDQEDMNMLVANAQNLMLSVQEAVNGAASASVKIMSQRGGPRIRWVRKSYY